MSDGDEVELVDLSWRLDGEGSGEAVAHYRGPDGEPIRRSFEFDDLGAADELPDRVSEIIEEDGRRFGVWTRK